MTQRSGFRRHAITLIAVLAVSVLSSSITFASDLVFGPVTCQRGTGAPTVFNYSFTAPESPRGFIFKVYNGGLEDTIYEQVSSSTITLNGVQILGPSTFNQNVTYLEVPVALQAQNSLSVEVRGKPGGALVIKAFPLVVIDTPMPGQAFSATSVPVTGHLYAEVTGINVNGVSGTVTGATFAVNGVPLVEGSNVLTAMAIRTDGFTGQASVLVTRDTTPPAITLTSPHDGATVSVPSVDVIGSVNEPSSVILVNGSVVALAGTAFTATDIPLQIGLNAISVEARDPLGNRSTIDLHVTYAPPVPTATLTATPTQILIGAPCALQWTTTGATAISVSQGIGVVAASGTQAISPTETTTYTLTAAGPGGAVTAETTVTVTYPSPTVTFTVAPTEIMLGLFGTLSWSSTNATSCSIDQGIGVVPLSGAMTLSPSATTLYTITANGPGGATTAQVQLGIVIPPPTVTLAITPANVLLGAPATLSWTSTNATSCSINQGIGVVSVNGSLDVTPDATMTYTITAVGPGGNVTTSATATVTYPAPTASLTTHSAINH